MLSGRRYKQATQSQRSSYTDHMLRTVYDSTGTIPHCRRKEGFRPRQAKYFVDLESPMKHHSLPWNHAFLVRVRAGRPIELRRLPTRTDRAITCMRGSLRSIQAGMNRSWTAHVDLEAVLFVLFCVVCT